MVSQDHNRSVAILAQVFKPGATSMLKRVGDISFGAIVALVARPQQGGEAVQTHCRVVAESSSWDFYIVVVTVWLVLVAAAVEALVLLWNEAEVALSLWVAN